MKIAIEVIIIFYIIICITIWLIIDKITKYLNKKKYEKLKGGE